MKENIIYVADLQILAQINYFGKMVPENELDISIESKGRLISSLLLQQVCSEQGTMNYYNVTDIGKRLSACFF